MDFPASRMQSDQRRLRRRRRRSRHRVADDTTTRCLTACARNQQNTPIKRARVRACVVRVSCVCRIGSVRGTCVRLVRRRAATNYTHAYTHQLTALSARHAEHDNNYWDARRTHTCNYVRSSVRPRPRTRASLAV